MVNCIDKIYELTKD